jgi:hypothetical protein
MKAAPKAEMKAVGMVWMMAGEWAAYWAAKRVGCLVDHLAV